MVLEWFCDQESRLCYDLSAYSDMSLLDESHCFLHGLCELECAQKHSQPPPAKGRHGHFLGTLNVLSGIDDAHIVKFLKHLLSRLNSELIIRRQLFKFAYH